MPLIRLFLPLLTFALLSLPASADFETDSSASYVYDVTTDTVLMEKNPNVPLPPASMSKLMTLNMLFEALRDGRVTMETRFGVSSEARSMGGSTMFLNERDRPTVEELIQGIIVMSGNDACVVVAEGLAGSEAAFARMMTERAEALGMTQSTFANASGWPHPDHRMSVRDLGILATRLVTEFPEYYGYFAQKEFAYDNRAPQNRFNRNPLLGLGIGVDGLKTGHTSEAGYGFVGSASQGSRRIVFVITGLASETARREEAERIVNWAFRQFIEKKVVSEGKTVAHAAVWMGTHPEVALVTETDTTMLIPALQQDDIVTEARFADPIEAPVQKGQRLGTLAISRTGLPDREVPLVAAADVAKGGFASRLRTAATVLIADFMAKEEPAPATTASEQ